jgi:Cu+-exporting ATPase
MSTNTENNTQAIKIDGMTCINCALSLEKSVKSIGINQVHVNFANRELIFENEQSISAQRINEAIKNAGFSIAKNGKQNDNIKKLITAFSFAVAIYFMVSMFFSAHVNPWIDFTLAGMALLIAFYKFGKGAYYSVKGGSANMYVLILLGASTAFFYSVYLMWFKEHAHLYFETTAVLVALVLIGDILEAKALEKTLSSINKLAKNKVSMAKMMVANNITMVSVNSLKVGDIVQGNLGDEVHTDAIITEGNALIDEALITGESIPIEKNIGDFILGGSQIIEGNIAYKVEKNAHLSAKAKINQLVQNASSQKANVQKLADRISAIFVPLILVLTLLSFFLNYSFLQVGMEDAILRSIAILVISCPCAMGLATPIAIMVGLGKMSNHGILIKNPDVFENLAAVKKFIFDKTGTLTTGNFKIIQFEFFHIDEQEAKQIILGIEQKSSHPIAKSIVQEWETITPFKFKSIEELKGKGMQAIGLNGEIYKLGSANFTNQNGQDADLFLIKNDELVAQLTIADKLKTNAKKTFSYLRAQGVAPIILSGDKQKKCQLIAEELDADVIGELRPEDKLERIKGFKGENTAMLGDGINDAPALAAVNVGMSFAEASNMAMQSADVIIMKDDMNAVQKAHKIAVMTYKTIKQNLFWAFAYNVVAIPLAAFGIINPMWAAFFMISSDLVVVGNAFMLKSRKV